MQFLFFIILFIINRDLVLKMGGLINLCELVISTINRNIIKFYFEIKKFYKLYAFL